MSFRLPALGQLAALDHLERIRAHMLSGDLFADEILGDQVLLQALAQEAEEEPLLVRVGMRHVAAE